jgi:PBP1b-binding outer membrane lipoprotein LpoB
MNIKQLKSIALISALIVVVSGCGLNSEEKRAKDCNEVNTKLINLFKDKDKPKYSQPLPYLQSFQFAASGIYPLMEDSEVKSITKDIANIELKSTSPENNVQLLNVISKINSLMVLCGLK